MAPNRRKAPPPAGEDVLLCPAPRPSTPSAGIKTIYLITIRSDPYLVGLRSFLEETALPQGSSFLNQCCLSALLLEI